MSKLVNSIAEDRLQLKLEIGGSPLADSMVSPRLVSPMKEVFEVTHSPVKTMSPEEAVKTPVSFQIETLY